MFDPQSLRLEAGQKRKRLKVNSACDACRDRKTRCDGRHPVCLACETRNCAQYCRYTRRAKGASSSSSGGGGSDLPPAAAAAASCAVISRRESVHSNISLSLSTCAKPPQCPGTGTSTATATATASSTTWESSAKESDGLATLTSHDDQSTYGSSSTVAFFRRILSADDAIRSAARSETVDDNGSPQPLGQAQAQPQSRPRALVKSDGSVLPVIPKRRDMDDFVSCYWTFVHPMFPILHKPTFYNEYNQHQSCFKSGRDHAVFLSMLNLVCALGCQFSGLVRDVQRTFIAYDFYNRSKQSFQHDWLDSAELSVVQVLLLNGVYLQSTQHANRCWNSVGLAIRASQILGLHVEDPKLVMSQLERQMRRRIWHTCVSLDRLLSMTFGRPTMIHGTNNVPLPLNMDDEYLGVDTVGTQPVHAPSYLSLFVNSCVLLEILHDVLHFVTTCEPGTETAGEETSMSPPPISRIVAQVLDLNRRLVHFSKTLPGFLHMSESELDNFACSNEVGFQKKVLYCR
ncbi:hypothetical protein E4U21_005557 [Claviceps maximensis]|nr:hypothetical protein E4U21_005557 [Claviceps maximensis]